MNEIERLLQMYQEEMKRLVEINQKRDYSAAGDFEFYAQSEKVYWMKAALVRAELKRELARS